MIVQVFGWEFPRSRLPRVVLSYPQFFSVTCRSAIPLRTPTILSLGVWGKDFQRGNHIQLNSSGKGVSVLDPPTPGKLTLDRSSDAKFLQ